MFEELDTVELTHEIKEYGLKEGDIGAIVNVYKDGKAYEVEFVAPDGKTTALLTLMPNDIRPIMSKDEYLYHGSNVPIYLSTASGTVSAKHNIRNEKLSFDTDTPKSKADTEEFRYPIPIL